jgi:DNA-binding transcriptional LysR family regulator
MLNLYKLEIFAEVVQSGSFSAAAEQLLMTQSGVSQHIQDLEASLGTQLFVRGRRGVTLTSSGQQLYTYTEQILRLVAEAENSVANIEQLAGGQIRVGATPGVGVYLLPEWIQSFRQRFPKLTVTLQTDITPRIIEAVLARKLELGFIEGELASDADRLLGIHLLQEMEQFVVVGPKHPFWNRSGLVITELEGQTLITRQAESQTRVWLDQMLQQYSVRPRIGAEFDNVESIKRSVINGPSLAILPEYAVHAEQAFGVLRIIPLAGKPLTRTVKLIWDKRRFFSPLVYSLLQHLYACCPTLAHLPTALPADNTS